MRIRLFKETRARRRVMQLSDNSRSGTFPSNFLLKISVMNYSVEPKRFWGKASSIATEDLEKLQSGAEAMGSSEAREKLKRDIKELSNSTLEVMTAFNRVEERLDRVGSSGSLKLRADINILQKRWKKYRQVLLAHFAAGNQSAYVCSTS